METSIHFAIAAVNAPEHHTATPRLSRQLHFASLRDPGRALSFPCDRCGEVQLDGLSERARNNYLFARNASNDYGPPIVIALESRSKTH